MIALSAWCRFFESTLRTMVGTVTSVGDRHDHMFPTGLGRFARWEGTCVSRF